MLYQKAVDSTKEYIEKDTIKNEDNPVKVKLVFYNHQVKNDSYNKTHYPITYDLATSKLKFLPNNILLSNPTNIRNLLIKTFVCIIQKCIYIHKRKITFNQLYSYLKPKSDHVKLIYKTSKIIQKFIKRHLKFKKLYNKIKNHKEKV